MRHAVMRHSVVGLALCANAAWAASDFDGTWTVRFATSDFETREAVLTLSEHAGTWITLPRAWKDKNDPCVGRPFPAVLSPADAGQIVLQVNAAASVPGCKDRSLTSHRIEPGRIDGILNNGKPASMTRQSSSGTP